MIHGEKGHAPSDSTGPPPAPPFLGIDPRGKTPEDLEREWVENHYRGDIPQLTPRAVFIGGILGGVMSLSNLYIGLKTGWGVGVAITACILSFAVGTVLSKIGLFRSNLSILENNCMQSTASSAGYSTGSMLVSAVPALLMIEGRSLPFGILLLWTIFLALLGVILAIPMKRHMINIEQLKFPSGIAAAVTLRSLYGAGADALKRGRRLAVSAVLGSGLAFARENLLGWWPAALRLPGMIPIPGTLAGHRLVEWTISFELSGIMIAAGAIVGIKVACSMMAGALINYGILAPMMHEQGVIRELGYRGIVSWSLWGGTALMVASGLFHFAAQWRTLGRAVGTLRAAFSPSRKEGKGVDDRPAGIEVPGSWFLTGLLVAGVGIVWIQITAFAISWWMALLSVLLTFFLTVVACRAAGETDITPIGAMGKITQLTFGVIAPTNTTANLMTACVTAGAAASSADLLTDLKSGYLLGANPRKQFIAQFLGIFAGAAVIVPAFLLLVPDAAVLGGDRFPAPGAQVWKGVAELLARGLSSLHPTAQWALLVGAVLGVLLAAVEQAASPWLRRFLPSAMGLGISCVIPFWNTLSMFLGALAARLMALRDPDVTDKTVIPVASGLIAGESLMGVLMALWAALWAL